MTSSQLKWRHAVAAAFCFALATTRLHSQQPPAAPTPSEPATDATKRFESAVVVTATRTDSSPDKVPVSTSVVTGDEIRVRNLPTLDQSLNLLEGVHVFRSKGVADPGTRVTMRGFNSANRTLILLDGQPLNDAYTGEVAWTSLPSQDVDRIEVARGSFSALYGGNAMGGVINVLSRAIDRREIDLSGELGSYDTTSYSARYAERFARKAGLSASLERLSSDGYRSRSFVVTPATGASGTVVTGARPTLNPTGTAGWAIGEAGDNWYRQTAARLRVEVAPAPNQFLSGHYVLQASTYGFDEPRSFLRDANGVAVDRGPVLIHDNGVSRQVTFTPGTLLQGPGDARSHLAGASYRLGFGRTLVQAFAGVINQPDNSTRTPTVATATATGGPGTISLRDSRSYSASTQVTQTRDGGLELTGGVDFRREWSDNREYALTDWTERDLRSAQTFQSHGDTTTIGAYVQGRIPLADRASIVAGARIDDWRTFDGLADIFNAAVPRTSYDDQGKTSLSGKVSAIMTPSPAWTLRGSIGTAFRNPTVFDLYRTFRLSTGTVFYANPNLEPEQNLGIDAGVVRSFGRRASAGATYFRNQTRGLIYRKTDLTADPTGRTRVLVNAGEGATNGVEIAGRYQLTSWAQLRAQYTYTGAEITKNPALPETEGKRVPFVPDHMSSISLLFSRNRVTAAASGRYVSGMFSLDNNLDTTKGVMGSYSPFFVADASLAVAVTRRLQVFGSIENLVDRQYYVFYLNPGRTASIGVRVHLFGQP